MKLYFYNPKVRYTKSGTEITGMECVEAEAKETAKCYCALPGQSFPTTYTTRVFKKDVGPARDGFRICTERDDDGARAAFVEWYKQLLQRAEEEVSRCKAAIKAIESGK